MNFSTLLNAMPGAVAQGLIWGVMAIGVSWGYDKALPLPIDELIECDY